MVTNSKASQLIKEKLSLAESYRVNQKKYTRLINLKRVTIALILKILIGFDSENLKFDHVMKNNLFGSL